MMKQDTNQDPDPSPSSLSYTIAFHEDALLLAPLAPHTPPCLPILLLGHRPDWSVQVEGSLGPCVAFRHGILGVP